MVSSTLLLLLVSCAAREPALRPLVELAPAPARALPFQTEEEAWRALLSQGGLPPPKVAPEILFDDRVVEPQRLSSTLLAPRFLGDAADARALMDRWTTRWAGRPAPLVGLDDQTLIEGVSAWALVSLAREHAAITATEGWTLRADELDAEAMMAEEAGLYALTRLIEAGRAPPRWRESYAALLTTLLAELPAPLATDDPVTLAAGAELRATFATAAVFHFAPVTLTAEEQAALHTSVVATMQRALPLASGMRPALPESLTTRLARHAEVTVERGLAAADPPLSSWARSAEGVYLGDVNDRGWRFRLDVERDELRAVLTVPMPHDPAAEGDLMALANAVNGTLDSAHLDLMPGELRLRHAWTPVTSDTAAAGALGALITIAERWAPLFEQVATKALTVERAWTLGQGDAP